MGHKLFLKKENKKNRDSAYENEKLMYGEIDQFFYKFDIDGDHYLTEKELINAIEHFIKVHPDKQENMKEMIDSLDIKANSQISLEVFRVLMMIYMNNDISDKSCLIDIFKTFDKNCSGMIGASEVSHVFSKLGMNVSKKEAEELIGEADHDDDNAIDLEEFIRLMVSK